VPAWAVPVLILAMAMNAGGFAGMLLQHAARAVGPSETAYQVDVGPTGLPWIGTLNMDMSWLRAPVYWIQYLRRHPRTWSVAVSRIERKSVGPELISETFGTYREARDRFRELRAQIQVGQLELNREK